MEFYKLPFLYILVILFVSCVIAGVTTGVAESTPKTYTTPFITSDPVIRINTTTREAESTPRTPTASPIPTDPIFQTSTTTTTREGDSTPRTPTSSLITSDPVIHISISTTTENGQTSHPFTSKQVTQSSQTEVEKSPTIDLNQSTLSEITNNTTKNSDEASIPGRSLQTTTIVPKKKDKCANIVHGINKCHLPITGSTIDKTYVDAFSAACTRHDICYKCGSMFHRSSVNCDNRFLDDITKICGSLNGAVYDVDVCGGVAGIFYAEVMSTRKAKYFDVPLPFCPDFWVVVCMG